MADAPAGHDDPDRTDDQLTPSDVAGLFEREAREVARDDPTPIEQLLGTPTRVSALAVLASAPRGELPLSVAEISERAAHVTPSSWAKHEDVLLESGVVEVADRVGGTRRFRLDEDHPVAQAWTMLVSLSLYGRTPQLVDEPFLGAVDGALDEATAAQVDAAATGGVSVREDVVDAAAGPADLSPGDVLEDDEAGADGGT